MAMNMGAVESIQAVLEAVVSCIPTAITQKCRNTTKEAMSSLPFIGTGQMGKRLSRMMMYSVGAARRNRAEIISTGSSSFRTTLMAIYEMPQKITGRSKKIEDRLMA